MAINKSELLSKLKADMKSADLLRLEWFNKISDYRNQTYGKPYEMRLKESLRLYLKISESRLNGCCLH